LLRHLPYASANPPSSTPPSVPEFTLKFVDDFYNVPSTTTSTTDPYTGKTTTTTIPSYYVENLTIEVTIKNQPFTPYTNAYGNEFLFYYNIKTKGHYEENWTDLYNPESGYAPQSNSEYTILSIPANSYPSGGQVDFQVQAMIGFTTSSLPPYTPFTYQFIGETSSWSPTQTVTIPATPSSPTPTSSTSTQTPTANSSLLLITTIALVAIVFLLVVIVFLLLVKRHQKTIDLGQRFAIK